MQQRANKQQGFAIPEIILVVVALGVIGAAVYFAIQARSNHQAASSSSASPSLTKAVPEPNLTSYSGGDFKLSYPKGWVTESSQGGASSLNIIGNPFVIWPIKGKTYTANVTVIEFTSGSDFLKTFNAGQGFSVPPVQAAVTINGNPSYYSIEKANSYTNLSYVIYHGGHAVELDFQLNSKAEPGQDAADNYQYQAAFEAIAKSVSFTK